MGLTVRHRFVSAKADSSDATLVQPSEWNDSHVITGQFPANVPDYTFAVQPVGSPSLTAGITNTVTLATVPLGLNGSDVLHYIRISGGTGTAEVVLVTGGTATSGGTNQTLSFVPANNHSGGYFLGTATAGIAEALNISSHVYIPPGTYDLYGTVTPQAGSRIEGGGFFACNLRWNNLNSKMFNLINDNITVTDMTFNQVGTAVSGSIGIASAGAGSLGAGLCNNAFLERLNLVAFYNAVSTHGGGGSFNLSDVYINNCVAGGVLSRASQGYWNHVVVVNNGGNAITLSPAAGSGGVTPFMSGIQTYNNKGWGIDSSWYLSVGGQLSYFNNDQAGEIRITQANPSGSFLSNAIIQYAGIPAAAFYTANLTAPGVYVAAGSNGLNISDSFINGCNGNGLDNNSSSLSINNVELLANGQGAQAGSLYSVLADATNSAQMTLNACTISGISKIAGNFHIVTNNTLSGNDATNPLLLLTNGLDYIFDGNQFFQAGAGNAYTINSSVSLSLGYNTVLSGAVTNNGIYAGSVAKATTPFVPLVVGAAVASAGTITPTAAVFHITGTAAIQVINAPSGFVTTILYVIPDAAFTLITGGNIMIASTGVVGKLMTLVYDTVTTKWYPSY